jgi:N-acetylated-alpha-linked acidic dipeptidase
MLSGALCHYMAGELMSMMKWRSFGVALACLALTCMADAVAAPMQSGSSPGGMLGFTSQGAASEHQLEKRFDSMLSASQMRAWLKRLSSKPNQVDSPHDKANAQWLLAQFKHWGWDAHIEKFDVLYPTPKKELVELTAPTHFKAQLHEPPVKGDPTSSLPGALPAYNIYSADGDVTGKLVYVNYGRPQDYKELKRLGVSVKGKIAIVRYGKEWRGLKPQLAYEHGAIGCLIYSDPRDDGYFRGDTYPEGGWRPSFGIQRGSVMEFQDHYPGDPTTPGYGSVPGAKHIPVKDAKTIQNIPVLPISYADATPLLKAMGGPVAPESWRGALGFTYHVGAGPARVHLVVKSNWDLKPVYDVIAELKGASDAGQWVIRGNHHDGWVFGAYDPLAGTVAMLGEAKAMGALYQRGWRPKRSIVYTSWDGEEPMLLGSTEWAETHAKALKQHAVLYLNSDTNERGFLFAGGSQSLGHLVDQVARGVSDPNTGVNVERRLRAHVLIEAAKKNASPRIKKLAKIIHHGGELPLSPLGSGSDYTAFLDHLGIATLNVGFGGRGDGGGIYHSRYDSFTHFVHFGDPSFQYEVALAKVAGHIVMRTANATVLPMDPHNLSDSLDRYVAQLQKHVKTMRQAAKQQQQLFARHAYKLNQDPLHPVAPPAKLSPVPDLTFHPLVSATQQLAHSAKAYEKAYQARADSGLDIPASQLRQVNALMGTMAQQLTNQQGLPGRAWYKNEIMAPGVFTGYGAKIFPAINQSLVARNWSAARQHARTVAKTLDGYSAQLDKLTALLKP